jgi:Delta3-Delta2-enoyl-CoA isomerase
MLEIHAHGPVHEIRLARPPVNALSPELIAALRAALQAAPGNGAEALVLSGPPRRFSAGLDVPALLALDRAGITAAWRDFYGLMRDLAACPVPIVAAITGHAPAGGAVLSLFCDRRFLAEGDDKGPYIMGLNEVRVGLTVPPVLVKVLARLVGAHQALRLTTEGLLVPSTEALRLGMVDRLLPADQVVPEALAWAQGLLALPRNALLTTRKLSRDEVVALLDASADEIETMTEVWFSTETQAAMRAMLEGLKRKG